MAILYVGSEFTSVHEPVEKGFLRMIMYLLSITRNYTVEQPTGDNVKIRFKAACPSFALLIFSLLFSGCQPKVYLMPTPVGLDSESSVFEILEDTKNSNWLYTLYATNREPLSNPFKTNKYSIFPSDSLRLGYVVHRVGDRSMTWDDLQRISLEGDRSQDLLIEQIRTREMARYDLADQKKQRLDRAEGFFYEINRALEKSYSKDLLVYVHGANSNFYRATAQGAQLFHFSGHNLAVVTFSWPSAESILKYKVDVMHASKTVPAFARLIEVLAHNTKAKNINILAYSAGAQVVTPGLSYLRELYPGLAAHKLKEKLRIGEVYFAAPDTDFGPFIDRYMEFRDIVERVSIKINQSDRVLRFAAMSNGISRLGRPNWNELSEEENRAITEALRTDKLEILNISDSKAPHMGGSHGSWYKHTWVSNDLLLLMLFNASPQERGLVEYRLGNGERGYYFPHNYEEKIREIIRQGREELSKNSIEKSVEPQ